MNISDLTHFMVHIGSGKSLSASDKKTISSGLPKLIDKVNKRNVANKITLPTGEKLSSATRITALKCHCLLLARKAFGSNYIKKHESYEELAKDVLFFVMRAQFNSDGVKGEFCCPSCTLSLLPLYKTKCFKWIDCDEVYQSVSASLKNKTSIFSGKIPERYAQWAIGIK